jgi:hypothetical protein
MAVDQRAKDLIAQGDKLFTDRRPVMGIWQTMAENFHPIRADFVTKRSLSSEFASNLMSGRPVLAHRDLANSLSAMLRPRGQKWFHARTMSENVNANSTNKAFLDSISDSMWRLMYDQRAGFIRATKQGDHDYVAFGQTVITVEKNKHLDGALYRNWHLRDVAWQENDELEIDVVHHNWMRQARVLCKMFPKVISQAVRDAAVKAPFQEIKCRQIVLPEDEYDMSVAKKGRSNRLPFNSILVDVENETILEEVPQAHMWYCIPRWQTVAGSQYAFSPSTVAAISDARMLQQVVLTLLEAGQKRVDPPLKATKEAIIGGVNTFSGGVTWVDKDYDERLGPALEALIQAPGDLSWGDQREEKIERMIQEAFFLNIINLPEAQGGEKMTAYETAERVKEYIRRALPLFEPIEVEYSSKLCELSFAVGNSLGIFGAFDDMPRDLASQNIVWQFDSPLQSAVERVKSESFTQSAQLLAQAAQIDPNVRFDFDIDVAFREALGGVAPAKWIVPEKIAEKSKQTAAKAEQAAAQAHAMATASDVATKMGTAVETAGNAAQAVNTAQAGAQ